MDDNYQKLFMGLQQYYRGTVATMFFQINHPFRLQSWGLPYRETGPNGRPGFAWKWCTFKIHWIIHGLSMDFPDFTGHLRSYSPFSDGP